MSEENKAPTRQLVRVGDVHHTSETASEGEKLQSKLLDCRLSSIEVDTRVNASAAPLSKQMERLNQSLGEVRERSSTCSTERNIASERSRLSSQRSYTNHMR